MVEQRVQKSQTGRWLSSYPVRCESIWDDPQEIPKIKRKHKKIREQVGGIRHCLQLATCPRVVNLRGRVQSHEAQLHKVREGKGALQGPLPGNYV